MANYPDPGYLVNAARTEAQFQQGLEDWLGRTKQLPGANQVELQVIGGLGTNITATPTRSAVRLEPSTAAGISVLQISSINLGDGAVGTNGFVVTFFGSSNVGEWTEFKETGGVGPFPNPEELIFLKTGTKMRLLYPEDNITFFQTANGWFEIGRSVQPKYATLTALADTEFDDGAQTLTWGVTESDTAGLVAPDENGFIIPDWCPAVKFTALVVAVEGTGAGRAQPPFTTSLLVHLLLTGAPNGYFTEIDVESVNTQTNYYAPLASPIIRGLPDATAVVVRTAHVEAQFLGLNIQKSNFHVEVIE